MSLTDQVRQRLFTDASYSGSEHVVRCAATYNGTLANVLDLHREHRIYERCGHTHQPGEPNVLDVDEVGYVCEDGYIYSICWCCCTGETGFQSESCASDHEGCWPCATVEAVAAGLGITEDTHTNP